MFAAFVLFKSCSENQKYNIRGEIESVKVEGLGLRNPIETSDKNAIAVLLKCLKKVKLNNQYMLEIDLAPQVYEITFFFSNGKTETYQYKDFPAKKYNDPLLDFFNLFPESP